MENREKMDRLERAKQFMPFAALKGLEEALRAKENATLSQKEMPDQKRRQTRQK